MLRSDGEGEEEEEGEPRRGVRERLEVGGMAAAAEEESALRGHHRGGLEGRRCDRGSR